MRYKHIITNDTISQVDYNYLSTVDQIEYVPIKENDTFIESAVIGGSYRFSSIRWVTWR